MRKQLILALILLISSFWPFAYAQPSPSKASFCDLGGLGVVNLNYDDVVAIQGIVTQDVLTSAENYKARKALEALGGSQATKASEIADKFRLYFVGPDGQVKYADVIRERLTSAQEWILNTTIFGRVEYGGKMGEDLLVCPDLPTNEQGMCNYKAGEKIQDVYSKDWTVGVEVNVTNPGSAVEAASEAYGKAYFTTVSDFVQMAQDAHDPFGSVDIGMSRIRSHKYVVSLAAPAGSQIFVIPKTYMFFMSQLKNLAQFEAVAQAAFMIGGIYNMFKGFRAGKAITTPKDDRLKYSTQEVTDAISTLKKCQQTGACDPDEIKKAVKMIGSIDDEILKKALKGLDVGDPGIKNTISTTLSNWEVKADPENIAKAIISNDEDYLKTIIGSYVKDESVVNSRVKYLLGLRSGIMERAMTNKARKLIESAGLSVDNIDEVVKAAAEGDAYKVKKLLKILDKDTDEYNKLVKDLLSFHDIEVISEKKAKLAKIEAVLAKADEIKDPKEKMNFIKSQLSGEDLALLSEDLSRYNTALKMAASEEKGYKMIWQRISVNKPSEKAIDYYRDLTRLRAETSHMGFLQAIGRRFNFFMENFPVIAKSNVYLTAERFYKSYLRGLYYVGRPITALAWGLQTFSILTMMNGYLEMSPPGFTLEWDPTTTGDLFTKQSYILIKGVPSSIPGMYSAGAFGSLGARELASFLLSLGIDPVLAGKYSEFGDYLIFGYDFNPSAYASVIRIEEEGKPTGITRIVKTNNGYLLRMANWKQSGISVLEDPTTMKPVGNNTLLTSVALITSGADIYGYIYGNPDQIKTQFPITWTFAEKLSDFGFLSQAVTTASIIYLWPNVPRFRTVIGATLITGLSKAMSTGAEQLVTAKATDMKALEECVRTGECERPPCEQVCAKCQGELAAMSTYMVASGVAQTVMDYAGGPVLAPVSFALGITDMIVLEGGIPLPGGGIKLFEGKLEKTNRCINELLTCDERNFIIIAGTQIRDPSVIQAEQEQASALKDLPGLDQLPVEDLLKGFENMSSPINVDQEQLHVHGEFYNATGRVALRDIYYLHIIDATIDFLANAFPFHMCGLTDNESIQECVDIQGNTLTYGNTTVTNALIPFKWIDTELPAMIIPNTAVYVNVSDSSDCAVFSVSPENLQPTFNQDITTKFDSLNFTDLERVFGNLRVINIDDGSIYPSTAIDGKVRLEFDRNDGGYEETEQPVWLTRSGKLIFTNLENKTEELNFRSAVFAGGVIVRKGDAIYILPRYFKPSITGLQWRDLVGTKPFQSLNGQSPTAVDELGNILGIDATNTRIPGADKLGIITAVSGYKDLNGDGKIQDNEKAGWRFYKVGNQTYFDLYYNGQKETYKGDQVEVSPDGTIRVYEEGKPHTDAYLLREISTRVDNLGRTLMTIKDGKGNTLLEDALITWLKGTGGSIQYNPDTNNYVFVNGQPIELNNEFKTNGFNAVTGMPDPPLLQPSAVHGEKPWEKAEKESPVPPVVPTVPESDLVWYIMAIVLGLASIYIIKKKGVRQTL